VYLYVCLYVLCCVVLCCVCVDLCCMYVNIINLDCGVEILFYIHFHTISLIFTSFSPLTGNRLGSGFDEKTHSTKYPIYFTCKGMSVVSFCFSVM
jgi:hypothetical protein